MYRLGHIASPEAEAERIAVRPILDLVGTSTFGILAQQDLRPWTGPVTSQVGNSCCWDSCLGQIEAKAREQGWGDFPKLSVKWAWVGAQLRDQHRRGIPFNLRRAIDTGSRIDMGVLNFHERGLASEARCPWEPGDLEAKVDGFADIRIPIDVDMAAADVRFTGDYGVAAADAPTVLRMAMSHRHFPVIAMDVDQAFLDLYGPDVEYDGVHDPKQIVGGHAMRVVGSRPQVGSSPAALLVQNSWGTEWGDGGFFWLTDHAVAHSRDAIVFTAAPRVAA